jgi:hypothetical protein
MGKSSEKPSLTKRENTLVESVITSLYAEVKARAESGVEMHREYPDMSMEDVFTDAEDILAIIDDLRASQFAKALKKAEGTDTFVREGLPIDMLRILAGAE